MRRRTLAIAAALLVCVLVAVVVAPIFAFNRDKSVPVPIPAPPVEPTRMVALGDSYTSGPGALPYQPDSVADQCFRSEDAYPLRAARSLNVEVSTFACSGATSAALTSPYKGEIPQLDHPEVARADIVVMSFGGNDVRALQSLGEDPLGAVSPEFMATFETEQLVPLAATLDAAYAEVRKRIKPGAVVYVIGYPNLFPAERAGFQYCAGLQLPLGPAAFGLPLENLHTMNARLNDTVEAAADRAGFRFLDMEQWFDDRDVCAEFRLIWGTADAPTQEGTLHPTADGHRVMGDVVAGVIKAQLPVHPR